jgi:hypothetical protein
MLYGSSAIIRWKESSRFSRGWFSLSPSLAGRRSLNARFAPPPSFVLRAPNSSFSDAAPSEPALGSHRREGQGAASSVVQHLLDGGRGMVARLCEVGSFVRRLRAQLRFGDLSRAPLQLLRLEVQVSSAECEWVARPADQWDSELQPAVAERHASTQALKDAIQVRELLFLALPNLDSAVVRVYRQPAGERRQLIVEGTVTRGQRVPTSVRSIAMRAKLFGLRFWLTEGVLENLASENRAVNS